MRDYQKPMALLRVFLAVFIVPSSFGCGMSEREKRYTKEVAICEAARTCKAAVECRRLAAIHAGLDPDKVVGTCEPKDAGVPNG